MSYKLKRAGRSIRQQEADIEAAFQSAMSEESLANALSVKVHENLEAFRTRRKFKKSDMAEMMGVSAKSYYMYETGKRPIPSSALVQLEAFTGADLNEVLLGVAKAPKHDRVKFIVEETIKALCFLGVNYEGMPLHTRRQVVEEMFRRQKDDEMATPSDIADAVKRVTRNNYSHIDLPEPPYLEDLRDDQEAYTSKMAEWEKMAHKGALQSFEGDDDLNENDDVADK